MLKDVEGFMKQESGKTKRRFKYAEKSSGEAVQIH